MASRYDCPWCSHESADRASFRTHLLVEHRKSAIVEYVLDDRTSERERDPREQDHSDGPIVN